MTNPYINHYRNQVQIGGSVVGFTGYRDQRGHGWFTRLIGGFGNLLKGILPSVAKKTLPSAIGLAQDIMAGENVGQSAKTRLIEAGRSAASETLEQLKQRVQGGKGLPRTRKRKYNPIFKTYKNKKQKINKKKRRRRRR